MSEYRVTKEADDKFVHRGQEVNFTVTTQMAPKKNEKNENLTEFKITDTSTGLLKTVLRLKKLQLLVLRKQLQVIKQLLLRIAKARLYTL